MQVRFFPTARWTKYRRDRRIHAAGKRTDNLLVADRLFQVFDRGSHERVHLPVAVAATDIDKENSSESAFHIPYAPLPDETVLHKELCAAFSIAAVGHASLDAVTWKPSGASEI